MQTTTKKKQNSGFTLAELLVVVAIIGVLVAVSIPIFTSQMSKAKLATNRANIRAAKAAASADYIGYGIDSYAVYVYLISSGKLADISKVTGTQSGTVDQNHPVCEVIDTYEHAMSRANNVFKRAGRDLSIQSPVKDIFQYDVIIVGPENITTCPYYDTGTDTIRSNAFQ